MVEQTQILLEKLSGGELQQLASELLPRIDSRFSSLVSSGSVEGTAKTRKGNPDSWVLTTEQGIICIEVTAHNSKQKIGRDFQNNRQRFRDANEKNREYVCFVNFEPQLDDIKEIKELCAIDGLKFTLLHNHVVSSFLEKQDFHGLRLKFLRIQPAYGVFLTLAEFRDRLQRKSKKLPIADAFLGREEDIKKITELIVKGNRILVIDGDPGIGKTRLSVELVECLQKDASFVEFEFRFVRELSESFLGAIHSELDANTKYVIVIDDANRLDHLSDLFEIIINPKVTKGSILILTTRSYNTSAVVSELQRRLIDGYAHRRLKRLSNADIDAMLQAKPFDIKAEYSRRPVVTFAKGNPRYAAVLAEIVVNGGLPDSEKPSEIFEKYFEGVFSEIDDLLADSKDKRNLALIAALRFINPTNEDLIKELCQVVGFDNRIDFDESLAKLVNSEILEVFPSKTVARVFDDSVSEYVVFRFFFSVKQKPTACGGGYVRLAMPVIPVESRFQAGRRTGIQFR